MRLITRVHTVPFRLALAAALATPPAAAGAQRAGVDAYVSLPQPSQLFSRLLQWPVWSSDSRRLAYPGRTPAGRLRVTVLDVASGGAAAVPEDRARGWAFAWLAWSPDGRRLAISRFNGEATAKEPTVFDVERGATTGPPWLARLPSGESVTIASEGNAQQRLVRRLPATVCVSAALTEGPGIAVDACELRGWTKPALSPDGRRIALPLGTPDDLAEGRETRGTGVAASPSAEVARLVAELAARREDADPVAALTFAQARRDSAFGRALAARAAAVDTSALAEQERLTLAIVAWEARNLQLRPRLSWYEFSILPALTPLQGLRSQAAARELRTPADLAAYLALVGRAASAVRATREKSEAQAARGLLVPRGQVDGLLAYYRPLAARGEANPFAVGPSRLAALAPAAADSFRAEVDARVASTLVPEVERLVGFIDRDVRARGPASVGMWQYPGGKPAYRAWLEVMTTLPGITPESVHAHGLRAMAEIEAQMARIRDSLGFTGSKAEFNERLKRDPRFYEATPDAVAARYMAGMRRLEPLIPRYFERLPKAPYNVRRLDPALEPSMTYGVYTPRGAPLDSGFYNFNGSALDQRSMLEGAAIIYHELVPGHHLQINLALENASLPPFRRSTYYSGFGEGWGEYTSSVVAREAGMYADPYDLYGRLAFDAFFAARLVVDTGMNYFGWSRERGMAYMKEHTIESDVQIDSETWRYSVRSPAQATAYRLGRDVILALRRRAERALGPRFDLRAFHDEVIGNGSLPLFLLQRHMERWIAARSAAGAS